jgi:peptide/nickel transport system substrate-binding protein
VLRHGTRRSGSRLMAVAASGAMVAVALVGCGGSSSSTSSAQIMRFGYSGTTIVTLNPFAAVHFLEDSVIRYIYPGLVSGASNGSYTGDLAEKWAFSNGGKTLTFTLRSGAKWSNGSPITASDAAWTLNTIIKYQTGPTAIEAANIADITHATAVSPTILTISYSAPVANALGDLELIPILPQSVWGSQIGKNGDGLLTFGVKPPLVTGGPFEVSSFTPNALIILKRDPTYYGQRPHLSEVGLLEYSSSSAEVSALEAGQINVALSVPYSSAQALRNSTQFRVKQTVSNLWDALGINSNPARKTHPELLNPKVREAIALALNTKAFISQILDGGGTPIASQVLVDTPFYDSALKPTPYNVAEANSILNSLGYRRAPDGIRVADGHPMSYSLVGVAVQDRWNQWLVSSLAKIGIQIVPQIVDAGSFWSLVTGPNYKYTETDMAFDQWDDPPNANSMLTMSINLCSQYAGLNQTGYCNKAYDDLYAQQEVTADLAARKALLDRMQQLLYVDKPWIYIDEETESEIWANNVTGLDFTSAGSVSPYTISSLLNGRIS